MNRSGRREAKRPKPERQATINRREGTRSRYQRCPRCKKLRLYWIPANFYGPKKTWKKLPDGTEICHLCAEETE